MAPRAGTLTQRDVPTCGFTERVDAVHERVQAAGWDECVVVNNARVVLGRLHQQMFDSGPGAVVGAVMEVGPTTIRPSTPLKAMLRRMQKGKTDSLLVTTSNGELIGVLNRRDVEQAASATADGTRE